MDGPVEETKPAPFLNLVPPVTVIAFRCGFRIATKKEHVNFTGGRRPAVPAGRILH